MPVAATGAGPARHDKLELKLALGQASSGRELRRFGRSSSRSSSSGRPKFSGMHAECPRCLLVQHWRAATADARSIGAAIKTFALRSPAGQQADAARAENDRPAAKVSSRALVRADYGSGLAVQDAINRSVRSSGRASVGCRAARADKTGVPLPRAAPARLKDPFSSKLLAAGHRQPAGKRGVCHDSRLASVGRWLHSLLLFQRSSRGGGARRSPAAHPQPRDTAATTSESESAAAAAPAPPEPMDITVRVEVQYHAPANAVTRDVLEMFRSTTWVRFMMRYISPRLKTSSPADQAILDELESQEAAEVHEGDECVICMSENPCDGHVALPCGHSFHYPCISSWLQTQSTCPVCRFQFPKAFTGKYAVQKLKSSMVLSEEQGKLPRAELLALDIGKQVVRAVVSVTLVKVAPSGDEDEFPCELSAFMLDPATGETFSELDCI